MGLIDKAAVAAILLTACSVGVTQICTDVGCPGALTVVFASAPSGPYTIELLSVTHGQRKYECADALGKCPVAKFDEYTPDRLVITISSAKGSRQLNVLPEYQNRYANGPNCGVTCRSATVSVPAP